MKEERRKDYTVGIKIPTISYPDPYPIYSIEISFFEPQLNSIWIWVRNWFLEVFSFIFPESPEPIVLFSRRACSMIPL